MIAIMPEAFFSHFTRLNPRRRHLAPQEVLFERDDAVNRLCMVDSGEVHLIRRQENGQASLMQRARRGALLAEASVYATHHHCAAVAMRDSSILWVPMAAMQRQLARDNAFAQAYSAHLARELRGARMRAEILSLRGVGARLDAWLAWQDGALPARGTWASLADEIGVSPEALYRELARRRETRDC